MAKPLAALVLALALATTGCASLLPPITNARLQTEGQIAVRGAQLVDAIVVAQRSLEPLVDAKVLTATEALSVAQVFGHALEGARRLVTLLQLADTARDMAERAATLTRVGGEVRNLLRTVSRAAVGVAGGSGRIALDGLTGNVTDALSDLLTDTGGAR